MQARTARTPILILALLLLGLSGGCTGGSGTLKLLSGGEIPTFKQNEVVGLLKPWEIRIEKAYWADRFEKPGYSALPESFRKAQEAQLVAHPTAGKFLIVELAIKNSTEKPLSWDQDRPAFFTLHNAAGREYASVGQDINFEDLTAKLILPGNPVNPDMSLTGRKVFDVPGGEYLMHVSVGSHAGGWSFHKGSTVFKWILSPSD